MPFVKLRCGSQVKVVELPHQGLMKALQETAEDSFQLNGDLIFSWNCEGDLIVLDEQQLAVAAKFSNLVTIDVSNKSSAENLAENSQSSRTKLQKRKSGRFCRVKAVSTIRRRGLGRTCPLCEKPLKSKKALAYHLASKYACPADRIDIDIPQLLEESKRKARFVNRFPTSNTSETSLANSPMVHVTVNNGSPGNYSTTADSAVNAETLRISHYIKEFEKSFQNPFFGSDNRSPTTIKKIIDSVKQIVTQCNYRNVEELYSKEGIDALKAPFSRPVLFGTKKGLCQSYIEFLEFLESCDDLNVSEKQRVRLLKFLRKAYQSFCRGTNIDDANRRLKVSQAFRDGELPTYDEVLRTYHALEKKAIEMPRIDGLYFKDFVCFVAFSLVKRCAIRPGALSQLKVGEFNVPEYEDELTTLVHVKGQKASQYNDGYVNFPTKTYKACLHYLQNWRSGPCDDNAHLLIWPGVERPVTSQDLGRLCKSAFQEVVGKDFVFTEFRQYLQSVMAQTSTDPNEMKWLNRMLGHSQMVGSKHYEYGKVNEMYVRTGLTLENEMPGRELRLSFQPSLTSDSEEANTLNPNLSSRNKLRKRRNPVSNSSTAD